MSPLCRAVIGLASRRCGWAVQTTDHEREGRRYLSSPAMNPSLSEAKKGEARGPRLFITKRFI
ncbi:hypothetical protein [Cernens ardua]|uniref:hypothetical protein n=1 Tax=Cernens ardua TaxID=3402176 RepID=UPI003F9453D5